MRVNFGPYKDKFWGNSPLFFQLYSLNRLEDIRLCNPKFADWLVEHKPRILRDIRNFSETHKKEQLKMMETFCGPDISQRVNAANAARETGSNKGAGIGTVAAPSALGRPPANGK
jgi:hypothetical protein